MRIKTRNFCWGIDPDEIEEGFVIPFGPGVHQGMDGVVIEMKCLPESVFSLGSPPEESAWLDLQFSFYAPDGRPLFVEDLGLIFNYEWGEVDSLQKQFQSFEDNKRIHFGDGVEPYGSLRARPLEDGVRAEFHFDAFYYLGPEAIFGGDFWFAIDMSKTEFSNLIEWIIAESLKACDPGIEHEFRFDGTESPKESKGFMPPEQEYPFKDSNNSLIRNIGAIRKLPDLISQLVRHPNLRAADQHGRTLLMAASVQCLNTRVIRHLAKEFDVNACDENGHTALSLALRYGKSPEVVRELIKLGADTGHILPDGTTLYTQTALNECGHELLKMLPRCVAQTDANTPDNQGRTPLHHAALFGLNSKIFQALLDYRAKPDSRDCAGRTPLHEAVRHTWYPRAAFALLKANADMEARDVQGRTPLMQSAIRGDGEPYMMRILRVRGADLHAKDNEGLTAADLAEQHGNFAIAEELRLFMKGQ